MIPHINSLILDATSNYGIVDTDSAFDFGRPVLQNFVNSSFDDKDLLHWNFQSEPFEARILKGMEPVKPSTITTQVKGRGKNTKKIGKKLKKKHNRIGKVKKCILKLYKKHRKHKHIMMKRKYMLPLLIGLLAAKNLLISIALKTLTFISVKGLLMSIFSTVLASILSLKGILDHSHGYQNRKDDTKTQVEIIQIPSKNDDHYYNERYSRGDYVPMVHNQL
ncbi:unnamed protein product [Parnassius mnemosyne]|uniref:Uncharacterized protein n=1 Tax=Parnassius mnemosyne TaxID=213953 RepID=A0AAV1LFZ4_9NEOP